MAEIKERRWSIVTSPVIVFPDRAIVTAYRILRQPQLQDAFKLKLACSILVRAIKTGTQVPPDTLDRLVVLAIWGPAPLEFRVRLAAALGEIQDERVQRRALAQVRDPSTPRDRRDVAVRLLRGPV